MIFKFLFHLFIISVSMFCFKKSIDAQSNIIFIISLIFLFIGAVNLSNIIEEFDKYILDKKRKEYGKKYP